MPGIQSQNSSLPVVVAPANQTTVVPVITDADVTAAVEASQKYTLLGQQMRAAEKVRDKAIMTVFEKLLGIKTLEQLKATDPEKMAALISERQLGKLFLIEHDTWDVKNTSAKTIVAWKEAYIAKLGKAAAIAEEEAASKSYSWAVVPKQAAAAQ